MCWAYEKFVVGIGGHTSGKRLLSISALALRKSPFSMAGLAPRMAYDLMNALICMKDV